MQSVSFDLAEALAGYAKFFVIALQNCFDVQQMEEIWPGKCCV